MTLVLGSFVIPMGSANPVPPPPGPVGDALNQTSGNPIIGPVLFYLEHFNPNGNATGQAAAAYALAEAIAGILHSGLCLSFQPNDPLLIKVGDGDSFVSFIGEGETWHGLALGTYTLSRSPKGEAGCQIPV